MQKMLEQLEIYFEREYKDTAECIARGVTWATPKELVDGAIKRCLGATMFIQYCGVAYASLGIYDIYKEKLENLLKAKET